MRKIITLFIVFTTVILKSQTKNENTLFNAKCAIGEVSSEERNWKLKKKDIDDVVNLSLKSQEIKSLVTLDLAYTKSNCEITVNNLLYNNKKYTVVLNAGNYITLFDGKKRKLYGCDDVKCNKYFPILKENPNASIFNKSEIQYSTEVNGKKIYINEENCIFIYQKNKEIFNNCVEDVDVSINKKNIDRNVLSLIYASGSHFLFVDYVFDKNNKVKSKKVSYVISTPSGQKTKMKNIVINIDDFDFEKIIEKYFNN
ncbi:hypothetical protein FY557_19895 [Chryseobacterium sp. SN22]|uniref:hypothetical protein n=1 Tax=Chryseobacterium sp. SN22 TaxID=2606431 RepID=UPI0011EBF627|nr:hypothetical protein [Chryseobacterium sp. SN22]KAA0125953.1 hypothetical protein FY557_19895 [Chryseobacterium sp. SN22]